MNSATDALKASVIEYCSIIGADPLLVQGAGGNISWKDGDTLWVKASGTWLAEAAEKDIFVAVDLPIILAAIEKGDFSVAPKLRGESALRPSIETLLHALMPHRVVIHLHAIEVLAHLVRVSWQKDFQSLVNTHPNWVTAVYNKPGAELAEAVSLALQNTTNANVVFLQNHGIVIGGADLDEVDQILKIVIDALRTPSCQYCFKQPSVMSLNIDGQTTYHPVSDQAVHQLATEADLFSRLESNWALYPDHVVFLGDFAHTYADEETLQRELRGSANLPELIFIQGLGVFTKSGFSTAKLVQLRCYYDILVRQHEEHGINALTAQQIGELLNWDAEKYRMGMSNKLSDADL